ncbi:RNB domain-containing ribonuclease [Streptomyces sp. XY332]|uniref:RNB domain-containing ribonuclease n=1 Tax=Streptomyces sp. XY332 TaxID=1415561 RepID=UPI0006B2237A|nr:RNB domain-containing ribonuclease [Streptomyces sp. XY332]KOY56805.1 hypothetical protein ADK59_16815 [Streptomyces sp. XY332]
MPRRPMHMSEAAKAALRSAFQKLQTDLHAPKAFPPAVLEAADAAAHAPRLPDKDATHLPLFTIDLPTSKDLDQAMYLERRSGGGFRVYYAIADVAAFVAPDGALDTEAHKRIVTLYFPDGKVPLHPPALSEGAASLLPYQTVPALLWQHDLDAHGEVTTSHVSRALVRSRDKLDYAGVQHAIDSGTAEEPVALLRDIGTLCAAVEAARDGISLTLPDQEVTFEDGSFRLSYRAPLAVDGWNEQISLMTGMAAARMMLDSGPGILRTQDTAPPAPLRRLVDRYAGELCVAACDGQAPPDWVLAALDDLPNTMTKATGGTADRRSVDLVEAAVLMDRVGGVFDATVIDTDEEENPPNRREGQVQMADPAVVGRVTSADVDLELGASVRVRLERADPAFPDRERKILFSLVRE